MVCKVKVYFQKITKKLIHLQKNHTMSTSCPFLSIIVPIYNVETYLEECLNSLINIRIISKEIILINDGSTDRSGEIAEKFASSHSCIKLFHQPNQGLSAARNKGLSEVQGEYIMFIDSDDWIIEGQTEKMFSEAIGFHPDIIMGNSVCYYPDGQTGTLFNPIPSHLCHICLTGKECFSELMKHGAFPPMVSNYLYKKDWLNKQTLYFENVVHEDELWTPQALCLAKSVYITNIDFYGYRQREGSIMRTLVTSKRVRDLIYIANRLIRFASGYSFNGPDREMKSELYAKAYMLYNLAFLSLAKIKNGNFTLPSHALYTIFKIYHHLSPLSKKRIYRYYKNAQNNLKSYLKWKISYWAEKLSPEIIKNKHIILIYNTMWDTPLNIPVEQIPENYRFTTDRQYYSQAQTVIFHLPTLINELENDLDKPEGQIWVAWTLECEENYPFFKDPEFMELFDYRISYHQTADVIQSYLHDNFIPLMKQPVDTKERANNICMLISSPINQSSRQEYLKELMREIPIDSYGKLFNNKKMDQDNGRESKINLYKQYKFVIAFENACATDYVTEKFFDPLIAGAVPIYLGAPNINEFAPGEHCFIHANDFKSPKELADYIEECYNNEQEYQSFFQWKQKDLRPQFIEKAQLQKTAPFIRLCELI